MYHFQNMCWKRFILNFLCMLFHVNNHQWRLVTCEEREVQIVNSKNTILYPKLRKCYFYEFNYTTCQRLDNHTSVPIHTLFTQIALWTCLYKPLLTLKLSIYPHFPTSYQETGPINPLSIWELQTQLSIRTIQLLDSC